MKNIKLVVDKLAFDRKKTDKEVYTYLGMSANAYYTMLRVNNMKATTMEKLSKFFNVPVCYFFEPCKINESQVENFELLTRLSKDEKADIFDILMRHTKKENKADLTDRLMETAKTIGTFDSPENYGDPALGNA